ncbi:hypothetical protein ACFQX7_26160 [Luedemannella flava]
MVAGTVSFAALTAACLVLGRHFARAGRTAAAGASWIAGATCVTGNVWAMMGGRAGRSRCAWASWPRCSGCPPRRPRS